MIDFRNCNFSAKLIVLTVLISFTNSPTSVAVPPTTPVRFNPAALPPPPNLGNPSGRGAGGRRGCGASPTAKPMTVLVPVVKNGDRQILWGTTTQANPTFWLHVPDPLPQGAVVELTLLSKGDADGHAAQFQVPPLTAGIVRLTAPTAIGALQENRPYQWKIAVYCNSGAVPTTAFSDPTSDAPVILRGGIQRVARSPNLLRQLSAAPTPIDQAAVYASNGIWYDALTTLGLETQTTTEPDAAIARAWTELLHQVNLDSTSRAPLVSCCTPK